MAGNPHDVTKAFEADLCEFTGARYAVAVNSCTAAIFLACKWFQIMHGDFVVSLPKLTYVGVPMSVIHAGHQVAWRDELWQGEYQLAPLPVWDSARRFTAGMYRKVAPDAGWAASRSQMQCVSFHLTKICGHSQGGAILHEDAAADAWFRMARFDGRTEGVPPTHDNFTMLGWHLYLSPDVAAALRWKLSSLPRNNPDLPRSDYPDLSKFPVFAQAASETLA